MDAMGQTGRTYRVICVGLEHSQYAELEAEANISPRESIACVLRRAVDFYLRRGELTGAKRGRKKNVRG